MTSPSTAAPLDVSFVIPLYDKGSLVGRAVGSALAQSPPPREIVVVDDGSRDAGPAMVAEIARQHPTVRIVRQANAGPSAARNRGIREAAGEWVALLDADDLVLDGYLAEAAAMAIRWPEAEWLAAAYREVPEGGHDGARRLIEATPAAPPILIRDFYRRWARGAFLSCSSVIVRRRAFAALGDPFPAGERWGEDQDVWFRLAERSPVAFSPRVLALYTTGDPTSLTGHARPTDPLPCYRRLKQRLEGGTLPADQRQGVRQLLATHWLNIAQARAQAGDLPGAAQLLRAKVSWHRPFYWLRAALAVGALRLARPQTRPGAA